MEIKIFYLPRKSAADPNPGARCPSWRCWGIIACSARGVGNVVAADAAWWWAGEGRGAKILSIVNKDDAEDPEPELPWICEVGEVEADLGTSRLEEHEFK